MRASTPALQRLTAKDLISKLPGWEFATTAQIAQIQGLMDQIANSATPVIQLSKDLAAWLAAQATARANKQPLPPSPVRGDAATLKNLASALSGLEKQLTQVLSAPKPGGATNPAQRRVLYHYIDEAGAKGITASGELFPSLTANNPNDVPYGEGQYMSDTAPGTKTPAQLSREFLGQPFQGRRFTYYVEIDVTGLEVVKGRDGVFVVPGNKPLVLTGRIVASGPVPSVK